MSILITGGKGQLGKDLAKELTERGIENIPVDIEEMDITDEKAVKEFISSYVKERSLDAVIHCAAYTAVDRAEDEEELAYKINAVGTKNVAEACKENDIKLMYISTDYVFDGEGERPWQPDDKRAPLNVYGKTKYEGELFVQQLEKFFTVRISWVFGLHGNNFIKTMLKLGKERDELNVVDDQIGSPTYTKDLSVLLADIIQTDKYGIYHASNEGLCSWYEFAKEIFSQAGLNVKLNPVDSSAFPVKAKRPHNSRMDKSKLVQNGFKPLPDWKDALRRYIEELKESGQYNG
jgi:dTDP-4-dehydrorhamnose reductase